MSKTIEEILSPKPVARPRIYAYSIDDQVHMPQPRRAFIFVDAPQTNAKLRRSGIIPSMPPFRGIADYARCFYNDGTPPGFAGHHNPGGKR